MDDDTGRTQNGHASGQAWRHFQGFFCRQESRKAGKGEKEKRELEVLAGHEQLVSQLVLLPHRQETILMVRTKLLAVTQCRHIGWTNALTD
jgi:hypothetical protein